MSKTTITGGRGRLAASRLARDDRREEPAVRGRSGVVYVQGDLAGSIEEIDGGFEFTYSPSYLATAHAQSVSLTLPLRSAPYRSETLFPFFVGLLSEGNLAQSQCRVQKLDEKDVFGRLLATCHDTIGAVTVKKAP